MIKQQGKFKEEVLIPLFMGMFAFVVIISIVGCISYYSGKLEAREQAACAAHGGAYVKGECYVPSKQA